MLFFRHIAEKTSLANHVVTLTFDQRKKSRQKTRLDNGTDAALFLERGTVLRGGDMLVADDGSVVLIRAAEELVSTVTAGDARTLARAAYHLGNRHVPLEVGDSWVRYEHDHVLDDLARGLGLQVDVTHATFEPEGGSYGGTHRHAQTHPPTGPTVDVTVGTRAQTVDD